MSEVLKHPLEEAMHFQTIDQWEEWVKKDWLYPIGSDEAHAHLRAKLEEEEQELKIARQHESPAAIVAEAGDVAWCASAIVLNAGFTLSEILNAGISTDQTGNEITQIDSLDHLSKTGLTSWSITPAVAALPNIPYAELIYNARASSPTLLSKAIGVLAHTVCTSTEIYRSMPTSDDNGGLEPWTDLHRTQIINGFNELIVATGMIAQAAGSTLQEVMQQTYLKHKHRKKSGQPITKPPRTSH